MKEKFNSMSLSSHVEEILKNKKALKKRLREGQSPEEILEFSQDQMALLYHDSCSLLNQGKRQEAVDAFLFLVGINSDRYEYWLGLGMANQLNEDYQSAIDAYELAAIMNLGCPTPYFYLAKCLYFICDQKSSLEALELAIELAGDQEEYSGLKEQALMVKEILLKQNL